MTIWKRPNYRDSKNISGCVRSLWGRRGWTDAQGILRTAKLFRINLQWWMHDMVHLLKLIELENDAKNKS